MKSFIAECIERIEAEADVDSAITGVVESRAYSDKAEDGKLRTRFRDAPPTMIRVPGQTWAPRDVTAMIQRMPGVVDSAFYNRAMATSMGNSRLDEPTVVFHQCLIAECLTHPDFIPVLADDAFSDMMRAAALSSPDDRLSPEEIPSPFGAVFFQNELPFEGFESRPVRAIAWGHSDDDGRIFIAAFERGLRYKVIEGGTHPEEYEHDLFCIASAIFSPGEEDELCDTNALLVRLVRSISAIAQSSHTKDETVTVESKKQRKHRERKGKPAPRPVRVLSLHNPEYGRYELDAATGRKLRQHWVRGHWRNQWYPKLERNKRIWVDGFVRGDAKLGTVTGPKVYVARGKKPDDEEGQDE